MVKILTSPVQGDVPFGGHKATGLADPSAAQDAATKAYVDAVAQGLSVKASVRAASTANIASQSGLLTVDGVTLVDGDRVLAKDQTTGSTNGIWVAHSGAWTRAADADTGAELVGAFVFVEEGTTNAGSGWVQTAAAPITVGTTSLTWVQFSGAGQIVAGAGLAKSGNTLRRTASATGYANLAALPSAAANNGLLERTADGGIYESDGSAWQVVRDPSGTSATPRGKWAPNTAYGKGDVVTFMGGLFRAPAAFTSGTAFNPANWDTWLKPSPVGPNYSLPLAPSQLSGPPLLSVINSFQSGVTGRTIGGAGTASSNANNTADFKKGLQSMSAVTTGTGGSSQVDITVPAAVADGTGKMLAFLVKIDDITHFATCEVYVGDSNYSNANHWTVIGGVSSDPVNRPQYWASGEWVWIVLNFASATISAGAPNRSAFQSVRIAFKDDNTGNAITWRLNEVAWVSENKAVFPHGVVSVSLDDCFSSHMTIAKPKLDQYGYPATVFPIVDLLGTTGCYTLADLQAAAAGAAWEVNGHAMQSATVHANGLVGYSSAQRVGESIAMKTWLRNNGFAGDGYAFGQGRFNAQVITDIAPYWSWCRTTMGPTPLDTYPLGDPFHMKTVNMSGLSLATLQGYVDAVYANGGHLDLLSHNIAASPGAGEVATATFQGIIDYIAGKGMPVMTIGDIMRSPVV